MGQSVKAWVGLTAVVALLVVLAGWFLLISPTRAATAEARANADSEQDRSIVLTKALETLKTQFANLDESQTQLEALKTQIPNTAEAASFRRALVERATQSGVTILSISTGVTTAVEASAATTTPATTADTTSADTTSADSATPAPSPAAEDPAPAAPAQTTVSGQVFVGIPLEIKVVGTYSAVRAFIASLQTTEGRLFLISGLGAITQLDSPASGGRPETVRGDVEMAVQGLLLALTPATTDSVDEGEAPTPSPLPSTERNPFAPVVSAAPVE